MSPATLGVDPAAEGVHAGVQVRAHPYTVNPRVVADVDDRGQRVLRAVPELSEAQQLLHPEQEARAPDAADQNGDLHTDRP
jgi:hypothetical protein